MNETINDFLMNLLQKNINLYLNNKVYRHGKVLLFKHKNYFIELILQTENKDKRVEIPIPFNIEHYSEENLTYFDYRLKTVAENNEELYNQILKNSKRSKSKYLDRILEIEVINEV